MKLSSQRLKEIVQEEIYNLEIAEADQVDLKQMTLDKQKQVVIDIKELGPELNKIVAAIDKMAMDQANNDKVKAAEYKGLIAQAIQGS